MMQGQKNIKKWKNVYFIINLSKPTPWTMYEVE